MVDHGGWQTFIVFAIMGFSSIVIPLMFRYTYITMKRVYLKPMVYLLPMDQ